MYKTVVVVLLLLLIAMVGGGFWLMYSKENTSQVVEVVVEDSEIQDSVSEAVEVVVEDVIDAVPTGWQWYENNELGFSILTPKIDMFAHDIDGKEGKCFGPMVGFDTCLWPLYIISDNELETSIAESGRQFDDRQEVRETVLLNSGRQGLLVTVTSPSYPNWVSRQVYVQYGNKIYMMGNGAVEDNRFDTYYKSLEFHGDN